MNKSVALIGIVCFFLWPLGLFLHISGNEFFRYFLGLLIVCLSIFLSKKEKIYWAAPILVLPFIDPKLLLVPIVVFALLLIRRHSRFLFLFLIISLIISLKFSRVYYRQSIFPSLSDAKAQVAARIYLYPNPFLARMFQNKTIAYSSALQTNFFALTDPNNYFFGFHPREIIRENLNLPKFPFIAVIFFLYGLVNIKKVKNLFPLVVLFTGLLFSLVITKNFDRSDLVLLPILLSFIIHGALSFQKRHNKSYNLLVLTFILFAIPDYLHLIINSYNK